MQDWAPQFSQLDGGEAFKLKRSLHGILAGDRNATSTHESFYHSKLESWSFAQVMRIGAMLGLEATGMQCGMSCGQNFTDIPSWLRACIKGVHGSMLGSSSGGCIEECLPRIQAQKLLQTGDAFLLEHNERSGRDEVTGRIHGCA